MHSAETRLRAELSPDERLVWSGQPRQGVMFRPSDGFIIPFTLIWAGIPTFMFIETGFSSNGAPFPFSLILPLFMGIGLYLIFGRFIQDSWRRRSTFYGLTDKRIIILSKSRVESVRLSEAGQLNFKRHGGGRGTIHFGNPPSMFAMQAGVARWTGNPGVPTFEQIKDADRVYQEVKRLTGV